MSIHKVLYKIAGVDQELLESTCTEADRIYARHLGLSLLATFCFVLIITYINIGYCFTAEQGAVEWSTKLALVSVSFLLALVITLFDRAIYIATWSKLESAFKRVTKVLFRVATSFVLALVLSDFLILKLFEGAIAHEMYQQNLSTNAGLIEQVESRITNIENLLREEASELSAMYAKRHAIEEQSLIERTLLVSKLADINEALNATRENMYLAMRKVNAEETGENPDRLEGVTGIKGEGDSFDYFTGDIDVHRLKLADLETEKNELIERLNMLNNVFSGYDEAILAMESAVANRQQQLNDAISNKTSSMLNDPRFIPLTDGPLIRLTVLHKLKTENDAQSYVISFFSWTLKLFFILIETAPILTKVLFAPAGVYRDHLHAKLNTSRLVADLNDFSANLERSQHEQEFEDAILELKHQSKYRHFFTEKLKDHYTAEKEEA